MLKTFDQSVARIATIAICLGALAGVSGDFRAIAAPVITLEGTTAPARLSASAAGIPGASL